MNIQIFGKSKCFDTKKAERYFKERRIKYQFVDIMKFGKSMENGKPDLNILFQYNMPLRALAKMTNGAVSMGMVDGIVMEAQGFWIIGLLRVAYEAIKNVILNAQLEKRLHQG